MQGQNSWSFVSGQLLMAWAASVKMRICRRIRQSLARNQVVNPKGMVSRYFRGFPTCTIVNANHLSLNVLHEDNQFSHRTFIRDLGPAIQPLQSILFTKQIHCLFHCNNFIVLNRYSLAGVKFKHSTQYLIDVQLTTVQNWKCLQFLSQLSIIQNLFKIPIKRFLYCR